MERYEVWEVGIVFRTDVRSLEAVANTVNGRTASLQSRRRSPPACAVLLAPVVVFSQSV